MSKGFKTTISFSEKRSLLGLPPTVYELSIKQSIQPKIRKQSQWQSQLQ